MITEKKKKDRDGLFLLFAFADSDLHRIAPTWNRLAPAGFRGLLQAQSGSPFLAPAGRFWWDPDQAQFGIGTRGYVPATAIRTAVNAFNQAHAAELELLALATARGDVAIAQWQHAMEQGVKNAQLVNAAAGRGGVEALAPADLTEAQDAVNFQFGRLERFAVQLDSGLEPKQAGWRAAAYAKSAISTYDGMRKRGADVAGFTLERNVMGEAEHCFWNSIYPQPRPDCPTLTKLGWVKLGAMPPIGTRLCLWNCRCHAVYSRGYHEN